MSRAQKVLAGFPILRPAGSHKGRSARQVRAWGTRALAPCAPLGRGGGERESRWRRWRGGLVTPKPRCAVFCVALVPLHVPLGRPAPLPPAENARPWRPHFVTWAADVRGQGGRQSLGPVPRKSVQSPPPPRGSPRVRSSVSSVLGLSPACSPSESRRGARSWPGCMDLGS